MTFQTEIRVTNRQHFGVHTSMRGMTDSAAFVHRFVFKHVRSLLRRMTFQTSLVLRVQRCAAAFVDETFVGRMTFRAGHLAFGNRMMTRQIELAADVRVAGETIRFGRARRRDIDAPAIPGELGAPGGKGVGRLYFAA